MFSRGFFRSGSIFADRSIFSIILGFDFSSRMGLGLCLILSVPLVGAGQTPQFPYKAQVIKQDAYVRSGPGLEYYPTDTLPAGQLVEVYRHEPGGWCAIRPPEGSFSWVLTRQIEIAPDGLGRANQDQVPVVVGSRLKNLHDVVQVYLKQGEPVELLEEAPPGRQQGESWCKIAPPSGEFRWIFTQDITPLTGTIASTSQPDTRTPAASSDMAVSSAPAGGAVPTGRPEGAMAAGAARAGVPPGGGMPARAGLPGGDGLPAGAGLSASTGLPAGAGGDAGEPAAVAIPPSAGGLSPQEFQERLWQLELELASRIMAEPTRWQLQDLFTRSESLLGQAPDAASRSEARQLLARISRFLEVQRQYAYMLLTGRKESPKPASATENGGAATPLLVAPSPEGAPGVPGTAPEAGLGAAGTTTSPPPSLIGGSPSGQSHLAAQTSPAADRFDAWGRLTRVVSAKPGAPTYALLDAQGEVVCYLTPAPGINLHPLEGKWIGVNGITGLMLEPRAKHVAVKQVALVDPNASVFR